MPDINLPLPVRINCSETTVNCVPRRNMSNDVPHIPSFFYLSLIKVEIRESARTWEMSVVRIENDTSILEGQMMGQSMYLFDGWMAHNA